MQTPEPLATMPWWFPLAFVALWLALGGFFAVVSGWRLLHARYPGGDVPVGETFKRHVARVGWASEHGVTRLVASKRGLYMYSIWIFRFLRPPLLVPWDAIHVVREFRLLWWDAVTLDLAGLTSIDVRRDAYEAMRPWLVRDAQASSNPALQPTPPSRRG